jgi:hypothetical protein
LFLHDATVTSFAKAIDRSPGQPQPDRLGFSVLRAEQSAPGDCSA